MQGLREESKRQRTARNHVQMMSEMEESDPEQCKRMLLRAVSSVQRHAVTETEINQVPVKYRRKAKHNKHLRTVRSGLPRHGWNVMFDTRARSSKTQQHGHEQHCDE